MLNKRLTIVEPLSLGTIRQIVVYDQQFLTLLSLLIGSGFAFFPSLLPTCCKSGVVQKFPVKMNGLFGFRSSNWLRQGVSLRPRAGHLPSASASWPISAVPQDSMQGDEPILRTKLESELRLKQVSLRASLEKVGGLGGLQKMMDDTPPVSPPTRLARVVATASRTGRTALIVELHSPTPHDGGKSITRAAQRWEAAGADAIAVATYEALTPLGEDDLRSVSRSTKLPVMRLDWIIHPMQLLQTLGASACAIPLVVQVLKDGFVSMAKFAVPAGMDIVVECVNAEDVAAAARHGAVLFGINLSIGLKLAGISGAKQQAIRGLLSSLPQGSFSIVGAASLEELRFMKSLGADAIVLKQSAFEKDPELIQKTPEETMQALASILTGDD